MRSHAPAMDPRLAEELSNRLLAIAQDVLGDDLQAMIVKGSAIKGDFIPDFSDFDVHFFASDSVMRGPLTPTQAVAILFQERFSEIDVPSWRVSQIQVMFVSAGDYPPEWIPALPGTFRLIYGELPPSLPDVTESMLRMHALDGLARYPHWVDTILARVVDKPIPQFADTVRLAGTIMKAALYEAAITLGAPPLDAWLSPLQETLDFVEPLALPDRAASRYYERAWRWGEVRENGPELRVMLADAITALEALSATPEIISSGTR